MQLWKKGLIRGTKMGLLFGLLAMFHQWNEQSEAIRSDALYGGIAFFLGLTSVIYQIEKWTLRKQAFVHYGVMHVTVLPVLLISGAYPLETFQDVIAMYLKFNLAGAVLFTATYVFSKGCFRKVCCFYKESGLSKN